MTVRCYVEKIHADMKIPTRNDVKIPTGAGLKIPTGVVDEDPHRGKIPTGVESLNGFGAGPRSRGELPGLLDLCTRRGRWS